ncbi:MAG: beta-ketoacyl synthase N-terminal-like domain-containing protein, partial [bacterium]
MNAVYCTSLGAYLPGAPIDNDQMETVLGLIGGQPSRLKARVLKSNGIRTRHYALDGAQQTTVQNEEMASAAIQACLTQSPWEPSDIGMLAVASAQGDLILPGFASQVQAAVGMPGVEILTTHGICSSGMMALKATVNSLRLGEHDRAVVCASELVSRNLKASRYEAAGYGLEGALPGLDAEFLRWMLSDGAAAALLETAPAERGLSLRVDWIRLMSQAQSYPVCMSAGR